MYPNIYSNKPSYSDKAMYYMLKTEEYNPDYKKVINKWIGDTKPQLYVFNHIW